MKRFIAIIALCLAVYSANAEVIREGKQFKQISNDYKISELNSGFTYKDKKGNIYPIFVGKTGSCYIKKTSAKTGKEYRQYLGEEISRQICKELGVEYTPKSSK